MLLRGQARGLPCALPRPPGAGLADAPGRFGRVAGFRDAGLVVRRPGCLRAWW